MLARPKYGWSAKLRFIASYFFYKMLVPFEVRGHGLSLLAFEWRDFLQNLANSLRRAPRFDLVWRASDQIQTKFGLYHLRSLTQDITVVSPAFERLDMNRLLRHWRNLQAEAAPAVFVDIGANIGRYAVAAASRNSANGRVFAFEPDPQSFALLAKNLKPLAGAKAFHLAIGAESGQARLQVNAIRPWDQGLSSAPGPAHAVKVQTLTAALAGEIPEPPFNLLVKIDVDGYELRVLEGAKELFGRAQSVTLLIEDVIEREAIYRALNQLAFTPTEKRTPYNSWWKLEPSSDRRQLDDV